nr:uncharacterized protein LOC110144244 [Odocoileus virginianus texanus]
MPVLLMSFSSPTVLATFLLFHSFPLFPFRYLQNISLTFSAQAVLPTSVLSSLTCLHLASPTYHLLYCHSHLPVPHWPHCPDRKGSAESLSSPNLPRRGSAEELEERFIALFSRLPPSIFTRSYKTTTPFSLSVSTRIACCLQSRGEISQRRKEEKALANSCWCLPWTHLDPGRISLWRLCAYAWGQSEVVALTTTACGPQSS